MPATSGAVSPTLARATTRKVLAVASSSCANRAALTAAARSNASASLLASAWITTSMPGCSRTFAAMASTAGW